MLKNLVITVALPCLVGVTACEKNDRDLDNDGVNEHGRAGAATTTDKRGLGEGELERNKAATGTDVYAPEVGGGERDRKRIDMDRVGNRIDVGAEDLNLSNAQLVERFNSEIAKDPVLKAQAGNVKLVIEDGDDLVLRGTVATGDLKSSLEDFAEDLADGRSINNEIDVKK